MDSIVLRVLCKKDSGGIDSVVAGIDGFTMREKRHEKTVRDSDEMWSVSGTATKPIATGHVVLSIEPDVDQPVTPADCVFVYYKEYTQFCVARRSYWNARHAIDEADDANLTAIMPQGFGNVNECCCFHYYGIPQPGKRRTAAEVCDFAETEAAYCQGREALLAAGFTEAFEQGEHAELPDELPEHLEDLV